MVIFHIHVSLPDGNPAKEFQKKMMALCTIWMISGRRIIRLIDRKILPNNDNGKNKLHIKYIANGKNAIRKYVPKYIQNNHGDNTWYIIGIVEIYNWVYMSSHCDKKNSCRPAISVRGSMVGG